MGRSKLCEPRGELAKRNLAHLQQGASQPQRQWQAAEKAANLGETSFIVSVCRFPFALPEQQGAIIRRLEDVYRDVAAPR